MVKIITVYGNMLLTAMGRTLLLAFLGLVFACILGMIFGLLSVFLPIILCSWHYDWAVLHHKGLICMAIDTVLCYLMVFFGCLFYAEGVTGAIIAQNLWALTIFAILAWAIFVVFRYIRCSRLMKISITVALCGVWTFFANTMISIAYSSSVVRPGVNFHNWIDFAGQNIGLVILIVGAVMVAVSMIRDIGGSGRSV